MFEPATAHVRVELIAHEPGQAHPSLAQRLEQRWGVLLNDVVQHRVFGAMAGVLTFGLGAARPLLNMRIHGPIAAHRLARDMGPRSRNGYGRTRADHRQRDTPSDPAGRRRATIIRSQLRRLHSMIPCSSQLIAGHGKVNKRPPVRVGILVTAGIGNALAVNGKRARDSCQYDVLTYDG